MSADSLLEVEIPTLRVGLCEVAMPAPDGNGQVRPMFLAVLALLPHH